jgi:hypothetical protein
MVPLTISTSLAQSARMWAAGERSGRGLQHPQGLTRAAAACRTCLQAHQMEGRPAGETAWCALHSCSGRGGGVRGGSAAGCLGGGTFRARQRRRPTSALRGSAATQHTQPAAPPPHLPIIIRPRSTAASGMTRGMAMCRHCKRVAPRKVRCSTIGPRCRRGATTRALQQWRRQRACWSSGVRRRR